MSSLTSVSGTASSAGIRKPRPLSASKPSSNDDSRTRAIATALHNAMGFGGAAEGEDARRPFCSDASLGYRIADPERPLPMRFDQYHGIAAAAPLARSPLVPVPLSKSLSAPAELELPEQGADAAPVASHAAVWTCKGPGCPNDDLRQLDLNSDGFYVCNLCGTVDQQQAISLDRQKNCAREDDSTDVADRWARDVNQEAAEATARGQETAAERRTRRTAGAGGTRLAQSVARKHQLGSAQSRLETQAARAFAERVEGSQAQVAKRNRVIGGMEKGFDHIGKILNEALRKHMRIEAKRVVVNAFEHAVVCSHHACSLNVAKRSNYTLALCIMHRCVERLLPVCRAPTAAAAHDANGYALARIVADYTPQMLNKILEAIQQLHEQNSGTGQIGQVTGSVGLLLDWSKEQICRPCADHSGGTVGVGGVGGGTQTQPPLPQPPPSSSTVSSTTTSNTTTTQAASLPPPAAHGLPPLLSLPPAALPFAAHQSSSEGDSPTASVASGGSPSDIVWNVRDTLTGAAREANVRADVRCAAMSALSQPDLLHWIRTQNVLPVDVLSVAVLTAATTKLGLEDCTNELLERYCYEHTISPTTARTAAVTMAGLMSVELAPATGVFGDGIF